MIIAQVFKDCPGGLVELLKFFWHSTCNVKSVMLKREQLVARYRLLVQMQDTLYKLWYKCGNDERGKRYYSWICRNQVEMQKMGKLFRTISETQQ